MCGGRPIPMGKMGAMDKNMRKQSRKFGFAFGFGACTRQEAKDLKTRWLPVTDGDSSVWVDIQNCDVKTVGASDEPQERGVVACCKDMGVWNSADAAGGFAQVHPPSVIQVAEKNIAARKDADNHDTTGWSKHEYIDKMRNSDPFLAHKQKGTKMKAMHDHVADKATESLGAEGVAAMSDSIATIHGKIKSHISSVVDALKGGSNSTQVGRVSGALRTSDPSASYKMMSVSQLAEQAGDKPLAKGVTGAMDARESLRVWNGKDGKGPGGAVETRRPMVPGN